SCRRPSGGTKRSAVEGASAQAPGDREDHVRPVALDHRSRRGEHVPSGTDDLVRRRARGPAVSCHPQVSVAGTASWGQEPRGWAWVAWSVNPTPAQLMSPPTEP